MTRLRLDLELSSEDAEILALLGRHSYISSDNPGDVLQLLIDHVLDGVRRSGSWERDWVSQLFGDKWQDELLSEQNGHMTSPQEDSQDPLHNVRWEYPKKSNRTH